MKKILLTVVTVILCISLTSCGALSDAFTAFQAYLGGEDRLLTSFEKLEYERPDFAELESSIKTLTQELKDGNKTGSYYSEKLSKIVEAYYYDAYTMESLAFLEYSKDITNEALRDEYYLVSRELSKLSTHLDEMYSVIAGTKHKEKLERECLGEGFLDSYTEGDYGTPDQELMSLIEKESELVSQYSEILSNMSVDYNGATYTEQMIAGIVDDDLHEAVLNAYYDKYNPMLGEIFVELVKTRQRISERLGYSLYYEYACGSYAREFSYSEVKNHLIEVKEHISPVYKIIMEDSADETITSNTVSSDRIQELGRELSQFISPKLGKIYNEMEKKKLCTVAASENMYYGSFQIYFNSIDSPYMFVNGSGTYYDLLILMHEFGHFSSAYYNYGNTGSTDEAEVASQALELLSIKYLDSVLDKDTAELLKKYELMTISTSINECAAYTEFENLVYSDPDLTLEKCNQYFLDCAKSYNIDVTATNDNTLSKYWILINHFFEYPYYSVGYSVSADTAVQLYEKCENDITPYLDFIKLAYNYDYFGNLEVSGLESPFAEGRAEKIAAFLEREYKNIS